MAVKKEDSDEPSKLILQDFVPFQSLWSARLLGSLDHRAEFLVEGVGLFKEFLADCGEMGRLRAFNFLIDLVPEIVVQVHCFFEEACESLFVTGFVHSAEKRAIVDECSDDILDVFLDVSKIHIVKICFTGQTAYALTNIVKLLFSSK